MAGAPYAETWYPTPDKTNHLTSGWTSKTLFTYQWVGANNDALAVSSGNDIITTIISNGKNYKGSTSFPAGYFANTNLETSGRGYKITVYYQYLLNGSKTGLKIAMYDPIGPNTYGTGRSIETVNEDWQQVKAQFYCTTYWNSDAGYPLFQVSGDLIFANAGAYGNGNVKILSYQQDYFTLDAGWNTDYQLQVINYSDSPNSIYVTYLSVEEVS